jgi:recombinational DNA repair protein (RecF pathway)
MNDTNGVNPPLNSSSLECCKCGAVIHPTERERKVSAGGLFCRPCAHDRIAELEAELHRLADVVCDQDRESIEYVLEGQRPA